MGIFDPNFIMNVLSVPLSLFFVWIVWKLFYKLYYIITKDNIKDEKTKQNYLEERYNKKYPKSKELFVERPRKENEPWYIHMYFQQFNTKVGLWGDKEIMRIGVLFFEESDNQIKKEKIFLGKEGDENETVISTKCWDKDGNEIECE